jgi:hypothetical protein
MAARQKLLDRLPVTGDILRGSLLTRTMRNHAKSCAKCASGEGHQLSVPRLWPITQLDESRGGAGEAFLRRHRGGRETVG